MRNSRIASKLGALIVLMAALLNVNTAQAQEDLGLCPDGYSQGLVDTGKVECYRESGRRSTRAQAEADRLAREAVCLDTPRASVTSSIIVGTESGGYYSAITCTTSRVVPPGTVLCPTDSAEVFRAFDTLVCKYFGNVVATAQQGQNVLNEQAAECASEISGRVMESSVRIDSFDDIPYFYTSLACAAQIPASNVIECPFGFNERSRTEDLLKCNVFESGLESLEEANSANQNARAFCTDTTAGLGTVTESLTASSDDNFISAVDCEIRIPRFSDFSDQEILRACDASCTEDVQQARTCLNGGKLGEPGCVGPATQIIVRGCNTGRISAACAR